MNRKISHSLRLYLLAAFFVLVLLVYLGVLYDIQVNNHAYYQAQSVRTIARQEKVEASRGIILDRNGKVLVSNRSTYNLTFDSSLLRPGDDENEAILRLVKLCRSQAVSWTDNLPISRAAPFVYTSASLSDLQKNRFLTYLKDLKPAAAALGTYLLDHPELLEAEAAAQLSDPQDTPQEEGAVLLTPAAALEGLTAQTLTTAMLEEAGISAVQLLRWMQEDLGLSDSLPLADARLILGVQYELSIRRLMNVTAYILAEDIDVPFISLLSDGNYAGARVTSSSVREYATASAPHILGYVGLIEPEEYADLRETYDMDDVIGRTGVEAAFETYLKGVDGRRIVSTNSDGKITGEYWSKEPQPGNTVELTIDLDFQQKVETALSDTIIAMNQKDGNEVRGAGAAVIKVGTGEVLALASHPTYDLATFRQNSTALNADPGRPFFNRATSGVYAPGSTLKPLTAIAALESGATTITERLRDTGTWYYPGDPASFLRCWFRSGHGRLSVTGAITNSCNYYFAEMGYRMGMDTLRDYLSAFGLGEATGIEIGERTGTLPENKVGENQAPWAAIGQSNQSYTPLQLANYIATLVSGGKHCDAHLLKAVRSYDNAEIVAQGDSAAQSTIQLSPANLSAVKEGMHGLVTGTLAPYFRNCVVDAGAKTGTAQLGGDFTNNGVFVCFAPYDDPEIAVAIVIEAGGTGASLASTAVNILNAYFTPDGATGSVTGENQLLP